MSMGKTTGNFDLLMTGAAIGWARMGDDTGHAVVHIMEGNQVVASGIANQHRGDLVAAGIGNGFYGFNIPLPDSLCDDQPHDLIAVVASCGTVLAGGSKRFEPRPPPSPTELFKFLIDDFQAIDQQLSR